MVERAGSSELTLAWEGVPAARARWGRRRGAFRTPPRAARVDPPRRAGAGERGGG
jgi:hypothetical protein